MSWLASAVTSLPCSLQASCQGPALERVLAQLSGGIYARNPRPADMPEDLQPSVSIGAVVCTRTSVTFDDLYQVADEALYVAKRGGKSQAALRRLD